MSANYVILVVNYFNYFFFYYFKTIAHSKKIKSKKHF